MIEAKLNLQFGASDPADSLCENAKSEPGNNMLYLLIFVIHEGNLMVDV